jgi:glycogen operon protein
MAKVRRQGRTFYFVVNAYWDPLDFELPAPGGGGAWRRWVDTALDSPNDIVEWEVAPLISSRTYRAGPRSVVVFLANVSAF